MPQVGPDVLMKEVSNTIVDIRNELIRRNLMRDSELDTRVHDDLTRAHIFHHLREKYSQQFKEDKGNAAENVTFGCFINSNPPYQNPGIVFPTGEDGKISTGHRFFSEELSTLTMIYFPGKSLNRNDIDLNPLKIIIEFNQFLCGTKYITEGHEIGTTMPDILRMAKTPEDFVSAINYYP